MTILLVLAAAFWSGIWWRFRGGGLTALTGFDPGTGGMRAIAAVAMSAPLAIYLHWWALLFIPALWVSWAVAGWGAFQGMGLELRDRANPVATVLEAVGFRSVLSVDLAGMAIEGVLFVMTLPSLLMGWLDDSAITGLLVWASGTLMAPIYFLAQRVLPLPNAEKFARAGTEWAEVMVGCVVGAVLMTAAGWFR